MAALAIPIAAAFALYQPVLQIGLLSDDYALVMWARRLELMPRDWGQLRPLPILTWWLLAQVTSSAGLPVALHALNVAMHGLNAGLVGIIAMRLTGSRGAALTSAAVFLTLPIAVEPVVWASGVFDVMLATLALTLGLIATGRSPLHRLDQGLAALLAAAMMATKETGVIAAPLFLLLYWARWALVDRSAFVAAGVQAALAVTYVSVRELTGWLDHRLTPQPDLDSIRRLLSGIGRAFILPLHRDLVIAHPIVATACATGVVAILSLWLLRGRHLPQTWRVAVLAAAGSLVCVAPTIRIFGVTPDFQGSRYVYLAGAWWSIAVASALMDGWRARTPRLAAATAAVVVVAAGLATRAQLEPWTLAVRERDRILLRLISLPASCRRVASTPATDNVAGAYVFRNGLNEALATRGRSYEWVDSTQAAPECQVDLGR
jgi:hypothetical protein